MWYKNKFGTPTLTVTTWLFHFIQEQCAPLSSPAAWDVVRASFSRDTHWLTLDPPRAHTCWCSQGQKSCDISPTATLLTSGGTQKTKSRSQSELRSPEGSGLANVLQWCFLVGKKKKASGLLECPHSMAAGFLQNKRRGGGPRWKPCLSWTGLGNHMASLLLHSLQ